VGSANEIQFIAVLAKQQYHRFVKFPRSGSSVVPENPEDTTEAKRYLAMIPHTSKVALHTVKFDYIP
jgi:hypothetical protein